jgi:GT2 family glycosyltransferase
MAIRHEAFLRIGGFRADLRYSEDIELQDRLLAAGGRIFYDPALRQYHYLEPARQRRSYYILRSFNSGRAEFRIRCNGLARVPWLLGAPRFLWRQVAEGFGKVAASVFQPPADRFDRVCELAGLLGQLRQALGEPRTAVA